jgi:hypothetical protein
MDERSFSRRKGRKYEKKLVWEQGLHFVLFVQEEEEEDSIASCSHSMHGAETATFLRLMDDHITGNQKASHSTRQVPSVLWVHF